MIDAHNDTLHVSPNVDIRYEREAGTGDPSRSYENPRYPTENDGGPTELERYRLTPAEDDTFITEVFYSKQLRLETSVMSLTVPWNRSTEWKIVKVHRGITEASTVVHDDYCLEPIQSTSSMIFGTTSCASGFTVLTDYRTNEIDAQNIYKWKMGQSLDAIVRHMQRHIVGLYLSQDRVPYHAMEECARDGHTGPNTTEGIREFLEFFENEGFNIVRKTRWTVAVQRLRDQMMLKYNHTHNIEGGVNNGARSCSFFITPETVVEAQENLEQLYVLWAGDLEPAGQQIRTVASWEYAGAPGCMFIKISPARYRSSNINWLESYVMRPQHTFFPARVEKTAGKFSAKYDDLNIWIPDFAASTTDDPKTRYYKMTYKLAVDHCMDAGTKKSEEAKKKLFEAWFDTGVTRKAMEQGGKEGWKDFAMFLRAAEGRIALVSKRLQKGNSNGTATPWQDLFVPAWDALGNADEKVKTIKAVCGDLSGHKETLAVCVLLLAMAYKNNNGAQVLKYLKCLKCTRNGGYLYGICEALRQLELPIPFGVHLRRHRVFREHMILMIDNYAAYHQEDVMDSSVRRDPKTGFVTVNQSLQYKDYIPEIKGITQVEGAYLVPNGHLRCGTAEHANKYDAYRETNIGNSKQVSAGIRKDMANQYGHCVHPVMFFEALKENKLDFMSTIGYDDPAFVPIYGRDNVLLSTKPDERYLTSSEEAVKRLGIMDGFVGRLRNHYFFLDPEKKNVKLKSYSWLMDTRLDDEKMTQLYKEQGPTAKRIWVYGRDPPVPARVFGEQIGYAIANANARAI